MPYTPSRLAIILASTAAAGASGVAIAAAAGSSSSSSSTTSTTTQQQRPHGGNAAETVLTGDTKTQAEAAALAAVPGGNVTRSSAEDPAENTGAAYEVHVTKSDGSEVEVLEDSSFKVTKVDTSPQHKGGPGHGGPGGHGMHADLAAVAKSLGVTQAQLQAALDAARPQKGTKPQPGANRRQQQADMYAAVAKALGKSASDVQKAFEANKPAPPSSTTTTP